MNIWNLLDRLVEQEIIQWNPAYNDDCKPVAMVMKDLNINPFQELSQYSK